MKTRVLVLIVIASALCVSTAFAQGGQGRSGRGGRGEGLGGPGGPGGPGGGMRPAMMSCPAMAVMPPQSAMIDRLSQSLSLTDEQVQSLKNVTAESEKTTKTLQQKAATASQALKAALLSSEYDEDNVKKLLTQAQTAETAIINASIEEWKQIRAILTSDQLAALQKAMTPPERPKRDSQNDRGSENGQWGPPPDAE